MTILTARRGAAAAGLLALLLTVWAGESAGQPDGKEKKDDKVAKKDDKDGDLKTVMGRVKKLTESEKGETDGAELSDGTVIHWPPHLSKKFTAVAKKGDAVEVAGRWTKAPGGEKVFEVQSLTNLKTEETAKSDADGPRPKDKKDDDKKGKGKKDDDKKKDKDKSKDD